MSRYGLASMDSSTHKNQRDLAYGPYHRYLPTCSSNNSVLTIDHGQNVVKQESLSRQEEVANNNASNHGFYCLRRDHGQTSQQWSCGWMLSCSNTFSVALFIVFDHVVVLRHSHSVNDNRTIRTFSRLKEFLRFYGWFDDWDGFVVSFLDHRQLYSAAGRWMNVAVTHPVAVFSCSSHVDETDRGCQQERQQSWIIVWDALHGQISQHKPCRRMFHCSKRSLQPYLSFSTSLLSSVTANPSMGTKHKYNR